MMVSPNSINILLILICLLLIFSIGHSLQVKKSAAGTDVKLQAAEQASVKAEMHQGVAGETEETTRLFSGGGRKTKTATRLSSKAIRSSQSHHQCTNGEASSSTTTSDKVHCIGTGDCNGGRQGCEKRKFSKRSRVNMSGFVSWNADYNVPRPHPPRNN